MFHTLGYKSQNQKISRPKPNSVVNLRSQPKLAMLKRRRILVMSLQKHLDHPSPHLWCKETKLDIHWERSEASKLSKTLTKKSQIPTTLSQIYDPECLHSAAMKPHRSSASSAPLRPSFSPVTLTLTLTLRFIYQCIVFHLDRYCFTNLFIYFLLSFRKNVSLEITCNYFPTVKKLQLRLFFIFSGTKTKSSFSRFHYLLHGSFGWLISINQDLNLRLIAKFSSKIYCLLLN